MKIIEIHIRIMKVMQIIEILWRKTKKLKIKKTNLKIENHKSPRNPFENHEDYEKHKNTCENHENHKCHRNP